MVGEYDRRRRLLVDGLNRIGLRTFEPQGAFYAFPRIAGTGLSERGVRRAVLLEERRSRRPGFGVRAVRRGSCPGVLCDSYEQLEEALVRIGRFVERHDPRPRDDRADGAASPASDRYEPVIGIEVHVQLRTESKMFCSCSTAYDGAPPNSPCLPRLPGPAWRAAGD